MTVTETDTPAGPLRLVAAPGRKSLWLAVLETDGGPVFPAVAVATPEPHAKWLELVARRIASLAREDIAADVARETLDAFVSYVRDLGDEAPWHFTSDDPEDMEEARRSVLKGLEAALKYDDAYRATRVFEREVYFGNADIRLVDLFRSAPVLGRVTALASRPEALVAAAGSMESECLGRSQMVCGIAQALRDDRLRESPTGPR